MVFLLMQDGSRVEIPQCENVVHRSDVLIFLDRAESPIVCLRASDVFGYTVSPRVALLLQETPIQETARDDVLTQPLDSRPSVRRFLPS
jgi:hypothetical protein